MAFKAKKSKVVESSTPASWSVAQFSSFYTQNRSELIAHANRIVKDKAKAEEITQEALVKFMLAAPELSSDDHALSYLHRTIENLCIDLFRAENRRPNLVALDDATAEVESTWQISGDHSQAISSAEDAAIIRQALSLLSPAERAALVMWEVEGRSTAEIAKELGIKESAVRHTVSRARASLRKVLSELIAHANRIVKDKAKAEEITQEALVKFMLAAPELSSNDHALSYLHRTIENLCIDLFRAENRRPNLVALDDATAEVESTWQASGDHSLAISAAEDAAISY